MKEGSFAFSNVGAPGSRLTPGRPGSCRGGWVCHTDAITPIPPSPPQKKNDDKKSWDN